MHGVDEENAKRIKNEKVVKRVGGLYDERLDRTGLWVPILGGVQSLCKRSTQYFFK